MHRLQSLSLGHRQSDQFRHQPDQGPAPGTRTVNRFGPVARKATQRANNPKCENTN